MSGNKVAYQPLLQSAASDDEDEEFQEVTSGDRPVDSSSRGHRHDDIEMEPLAKLKHKQNKHEEFTVKYYDRKMCLLVSAAVVVVCVVVTASVVVVTLPQHDASRPDWSVVFDHSASESSIQTVDIDGDGLDDILLGITNPALTLSGAQFNNKHGRISQFCAEHNLSSPCVGLLIALRGYDGKELWRMPTHSGVLFVKCGEVDVNQDGRYDCIVTGRHGTIHAVDTFVGQSLWTVDVEREATHFNRTWNTFQALTMVDFDGDGVAEILVAHGGDPYATPANHQRISGRLVLLSGATGRPLGHFLPMPNDKETYMSPVEYRAPDGSRYVLFGSGGETVPGDFMAVSFADLYRHVMGYPTWTPVPGVDNKTVDWWSDIPRGAGGVITIYSGQEKGIMVPPLLVDVTRDGVADILMTAFEGRMVMFDGKTLHPVWTATFPGMESYSSPAPGYFDGDDVIDFMMHWNAGIWQDYNYSQVVVVSGVDGRTIWSTSTMKYVMSSDIVLRQKGDHKDLFVVKVKGRVKSGAKVHHINKRHFGGHESKNTDSDVCADRESDYKADTVLCDDVTDSLNEEMIAVDGSCVRQALRIALVRADTFYYSVYSKRNETSCIHLDPVTHSADVCAVFEPIVKNTDAVADVDGDGKPDLVSLNQWMAPVRDARYSFVRGQFRVRVSKTDLPQALKRGDIVNLDVSTTTFSNTVNAREHYVSMKFIPLSQQRWTKYLGSKVNGKY